MQATEKTARDQFVEDFLLVAENDYEFYQQHREIYKFYGATHCAQVIQEEFERWIDSLAGEEEERSNEFGALLLRQLLIGWGDETFYKIAERFKSED